MVTVRHFDLVVIGSGSANTILDRRFAGLDVALVEAGTFGGTCLNVGCIPTKMLVHPADLARSPGHAHRLGVDLRLEGVRWADIRDRIFGRIDPLSAAGLRHRQDNPRITVISQRVRFVGPRRLQTDDGEQLTADRVVIGAGSRPLVPEIDGLADVAFHTSDTVMRIDELPRSLVILGGGYVAAEFAHVFGAFGVQVTVVSRSATLLSREDAEIARLFTDQLSRRVDVRRSTQAVAVEPGPSGGVRVRLKHPEHGDDLVEADLLLVATGRVPNGDTLNLQAAGVEVDDAGLIVVDPYQRTTAEGVYALGDCSSPDQLKHVANADARVVQHNLLHPDDPIRSARGAVPHAVFSSPQVASVGLTEEQARAGGVDYVVGTHSYADVAYGWAMEEEAESGNPGNIVKVLAERGTRRLVGAHLLGPEASSLIQPLIQAIAFGTPAPEVARGQYWIHPALAEVVENALLALRFE